MNRSSVCLASSIVGLLAVVISPSAGAAVGDDPVLSSGIASCTYTDIQAHIGPANDVSYKVYGSCSGSAVSGRMGFSNGQFQEEFIANNAKIRTLGYCDTDPWATAVNCHDQTVQSSGAFEPGLLKAAPLSLISGNYQGFHNAYLNASRPNPPGLPVNFSAIYNPPDLVTARWLAPDASGDRPFLGFLLQVRPQHAEGAAWIDLGRIAWHAQPDYVLVVKLPARSVAISYWDARLCSTTALAATCTPVLGFMDSTPVVAADTKKDDSALFAALGKPTAVKAIGRVETRVTSPPLPICDAARAAKARNSPAAPGLEQQCLASGGSMTSPAPPPAANDSSKLDDLAAVGAAIATQDPAVAKARSAEAGAFYQLGFDVATGIFGDPALGALGHTATGPGSDKIRDSLSAAGQRGFNDSVKFHLARNYTH